MTEITREFLEGHRARMSQQIVAFQGALEMLDVLLKKLDEPEPVPQTMTVSQLQEAITRGQEQ